MVRVECHAQAHNTMSQARAQTLESSAVTMRPLRRLNLTNLGGLTRQSNEKADKQSKWWTYSLLIFLCGNTGPGKETNAVQATWRLFPK